MIAAVSLVLCSVLVALWHVVHPVPIFVRTLALLVLGGAPVLLLICIALEFQAVVLVSVFVMICAFVTSQWLTRRRRRYQLWLIELVLLTKASSLAPLRQLNRRMRLRSGM
ncbi:hypothetical protein [Paraburkholderia sacchari]|uniref:hypothetical protein n=1 Tax=Paraburkholderia sacchari TaxID=159450 RepID=UPI001BCE18ED|nr:hypothetical protein [Paraburkholderia sacchari]